MDRTEVAALAEGMVPFVRDCVSEATAQLISRIAELETRPIVKGDAGPQGEIGPQGPPGPKGDNGELAMLPPALAEQVASAVRLLHESPPPTGERAPSKVVRIERDEHGNLIPIYD